MKTKKFSEVPNCIEMYKQKKYILEEETSEYLLFKKKFGIISWILWTSLFFWIGVVTMETMLLGMFMFIAYPISIQFDTIKVIKNE